MVKIIGQNNVGKEILVKIIFCQKIFDNKNLCQKNSLSKKFEVKNNFWSKKLSIKNNFWSKIIAGQKKFGQKIISKKILLQIILVFFCKIILVFFFVKLF